MKYFLLTIVIAAGVFLGINAKGLYHSARELVLDSLPAEYILVGSGGTLGATGGDRVFYEDKKLSLDECMEFRFVHLYRLGTSLYSDYECVSKR